MPLFVGLALSCVHMVANKYHKGQCVQLYSGQMYNINTGKLFVVWIETNLISEYVFYYELLNGDLWMKIKWTNERFT